MKRVRALLEHATSMARPFHVICGQDPSSSMPWCSSLGPYKLWYAAGTELSEEDDPMIIRQAAMAPRRRLKVPHKKDRPLKTRSLKKDPLLKKRVVFLVHKSIPITDWRVRTYNNHNADLVATLSLATSGEVMIHNVYNHSKNLNIDKLMDTCFGATADILAGDFNLHHPSWCSDDMTFVVENDAKKLYYATEAADMKLISTKGAITYSWGTRADQNASTIDLVFGGPAIVSRDPQWSIVEVDGFDSDHRVTQTSFDIEPTRATDNRLDWRRANRKLALRLIENSLRSLQKPALLSTAEIDEYTAKLVDLLRIAMITTVPKVKPRTYLPSLRSLPKIKFVFDNAKDALKMSMSNTDPEQRHNLARYQDLQRSAENLLGQTKLGSFRHFLDSGSKRSLGHFRIADVGKRMCQPKPVPHLETLIVDEVSHETTPTMTRILISHLWPDTSEERATPIPKPSLDPLREQYVSPQEVEDGEVEQLIKKMKAGKAAGIDGLASTFVKWSRDIITPFLKHLFSACISLGHEPSQFKAARTVILRKPDKRTYTIPNSWRPIALLSSFGKLLEAIIAH